MAVVVVAAVVEACVEGPPPSHSLSCLQASFVASSVELFVLGQSIVQIKNLTASVEVVAAPYDQCLNQNY